MKKLILVSALTVLGLHSGSALSNEPTLTDENLNPIHSTSLENDLDSSLRVLCVARGGIRRNIRHFRAIGPNYRFAHRRALRKCQLNVRADFTCQVIRCRRIF